MKECKKCGRIVMKCDKCGNEREWHETINKGMKEIVTYVDGYIVLERREFEKERGFVTCAKCGQIYNEYDL